MILKSRMYGKKKGKVKSIVNLWDTACGMMMLVLIFVMFIYVMINVYKINSPAFSLVCSYWYFIFRNKKHQ